MEDKITESDMAPRPPSSSCKTPSSSDKTLQRKIAEYNKKSALPPLNDFGVAVGRKPLLLPDIHLPQLVVALTNSAGMTQTPHELSGRLMKMTLCTPSGISSSSCYYHYPPFCPWQMDSTH
jgi:hypothetical protein